MSTLHTKPQRAVLSTLRSLLRHINSTLDNRTGPVLSKDMSLWRDEIMGEYRRNKGAKGPEMRAARAKANEVLASLTAVKEQKGLFFRYGGISGDTPDYRKAAANRVGVTIPDRVPLKDFDHSKYFRQ